MSGLDVSRERFQEAARVREAYDIQLGRLRGSWRSAKPGPAAERARRKVAAALEQARAAQAAEDAAWTELSEALRG